MSSKGPTDTSNTQVATDSSLPNPKTLLYASKLAIEQDKPIQMDYYIQTGNGIAFMGIETDTKEKMLVKSAVEYTSHIEKMIKVSPEDFIVLTANSIYIVNSKIQKKPIESSSLRSHDDS